MLGLRVIVCGAFVLWAAGDIVDRKTSVLLCFASFVFHRTYLLGTFRMCQLGRFWHFSWGF